MAGLDMTSFDSELKEHYAAELPNLIYRRNPFLAMVPKKEDAGGSEYVQPIVYGTGGRRSADITVAQTGASASSTKAKAFHVLWVKDYAVARVDGLTIAASKGDRNSFVDALTQEINSSIQELTNTIARDVFRGGWGSVGVISAINSATITLATIEDVDSFEVGDICVFALTEAGDLLRNSGAGLTVSACDRDLGTVTFSAAVSTETGTVVGDSVFLKGDRQNSATPTRVKLMGLGGWLPTTAPSASESFFQVDRSADAVRLGGLRYAPQAGTSIDTILQNAAYRVGRQGGELDTFFMSYGRLNDLVSILGSKAKYEKFDVGKVGFQSVEILGPDGPISCVADRNVPANRIFGLDMSTWTLASMGKMVELANISNSAEILRMTSEDSYESRWRFYGNLACSAPGRNIVVSMVDPVSN